MKDKDEVIRFEAAGALGRVGDARAVEPLTDALKDENDNVRRYATDALEKLNGKKG